METVRPLATRCFNISDVSKRETVCAGRICKGSPSFTTVGQRPQRFCFYLYASMSRLHLLRRPQADRSRPMLKTSAGHIVISSATVTRAGSPKPSSSDLLLPGLIVLLVSFWTPRSKLDVLCAQEIDRRINSWPADWRMQSYELLHPCRRHKRQPSL